MHNVEQEEYTDRPPPIDFSKLTDTEKLSHICEIVVHMADGLVQMSRNITVLNSRLGVEEEDGLSLNMRMGRFETLLVEQCKDLELLRTHILGRGASIHELQLVEINKTTADSSHR